MGGKLFIPFLILLLSHAVFGSYLRTSTKRLSNEDFVRSINFDSKEGQLILLDESTNLKCYFNLAEYFVTQETQTYCAVASASMVLNALKNKVERPVDPSFKPHPFFTQEDFLSNNCVAKHTKGIRFMGVTLEALAKSIDCFTSSVEFTHFSDNIDMLQAKIISAIDAGKFVIANVDRKGLNEPGGGHFSPVGAYTRAIDGSVRFLFMDVSRYKYRPSWIDAREIIYSMKAMDSASMKSRGFLVVG